ncbi:MAG: hypothetical protein KatS3mg014_2210 [Actinomycetota bacterium]|nr:MAG: hypothetical protein KatS3mg014_2210 [Actinomycetota bacterium]
MRSTLEAPPRPPDPMLPGMGLVMVSRDLYEDELARRGAPRAPRRPRGRRKGVRRGLAVAVALVLVSSAVGAAVLATRDARREIHALRDRVAVLRAELAGAVERAEGAEAHAADLAARIEELRARVAELRRAKVRTVVRTETETVTETVYVPNGRGVSVEVTGYEGMVRIYDVQLTHAYGYSDLIGIAENTSGRVISYAQLGCSFLDRDGRLLATSMDNKQDWRPGQTWGFVCSAEVDATGGILRVDELS